MENNPPPSASDALEQQQKDDASHWPPKPLTTIQSEARAAFDEKFVKLKYPNGTRLAIRNVNPDSIKSFLDTQLSLAHAAGKAEGREEATKEINLGVFEELHAAGRDDLIQRVVKENRAKEKN